MTSASAFSAGSKQKSTVSPFRRDRLAAEEGARAREAARARAGPPASPRAGDGRALARPRPGSGGEQPAPGGARRAARARRRRDRGAGRGALARREIDVDRFEQAAPRTRAASKTPAAYSAALSLYGGELLPENRYDDWAEAETRRAGDARRRARRGVVRRSGPPAVRAAGRRELVRRPGQELTELNSLLRRTRLLTLAGTGGAGKTRLALELARSAERSYEDGAALVELRRLTDARA